MEPVTLTQEAAIWLLNLAHVECDGLQMEINAANRARQNARELEAERDALRAELAEVRAERDRLRDYRERATAETFAPTGWIKVGVWAWANPDGRLVRSLERGNWIARSADFNWFGDTAVAAARAAGWHDFPGLTDHSAGDP